MWGVFFALCLACGSTRVKERLLPHPWTSHGDGLPRLCVRLRRLSYTLWMRLPWMCTAWLLMSSAKIISSHSWKGWDGACSWCKRCR